MADIVQRRRPNLRDMKAFVEAEGLEESAQVLAQTVPWRSYGESKLLSQAEVGLFLDYDGASGEERADLLDDQGEVYAALFAKALRDIAQEVGVLPRGGAQSSRGPNPSPPRRTPTQATVKYVLALVDQLLREDPGRARHFHALLAADDAVAPYAPFLGILMRHGYLGHEFAVAKAAQVLAVLLAHAPPANDGAEAAPELLDFLQWCVGRVDAAAKGAETVVVVGALKTLLRAEHAQVPFVRQAGGLRALTALLRKEQLGSQLVYVTVFCVWLLTFNEELLADLHDSDTVSRIVSVLRDAPREKVVRVCFAALENLLDRDSFNEVMAVSDLPRLLPPLLQRKLEDEDLRASMERVDETLKLFVRMLSSHDKYVAELETGCLHWSPVHNEKFWRMNAAEFEGNQFAHIKKLCALLASEDELTLEVACYDIGEFARFHPDGRRVVDKFGAKARLMELLSHGSTKVAKMALLTVQKLMVTHWESLAAGTSQGRKA